MSQPAVPPSVTLPIATIQDDFTTVLSEVHAGITPSESIWLSCYKDGEPSIHGKVAIGLHEKDRDRIELTGAGGVDLTRTSPVRDYSSGHRSFRLKTTASHLVQIHSSLLRPRNRLGGARLSCRGLCRPIALGRETCEYVVLMKVACEGAMPTSSSTGDSRVRSHPLPSPVVFLQQPYSMGRSLSTLFRVPLRSPRRIPYQPHTPCSQSFPRNYTNPS